MKLSIESPKIEQVFNDKKMLEELAIIVDRGKVMPMAKKWNINNEMLKAIINEKAENVHDAIKNRPYTEAVILDFMRPSLLIKNNQFQVPFSDELAKRLIKSKYVLQKRIPSVGRIEFQNHPSMRWGGTGWVIAENLIVTNRHVAEEFATRDNQSFKFKTDIIGRQITSRVDFYEEYSSDNVFELEVEKIVFYEPDNKKPDIAFLKIKSGAKNPQPIPISKMTPRDAQDIAVIGYPARDQRGVSDSEVAERIFGDIYDVKRLSPGKVIISNDADWFFTHDATTMGGNSGSVVLDMETGHALGLHFAGQLKQANYAVKCNEVLDYLSKLNTTITIPKEFIAEENTFDTDVLTEGKVEDYKDKSGFDVKFLGKNIETPLPKILNTNDILNYEQDGEIQTVLDYTHFSLEMSKSRRLCFYSAVNIDGGEIKRFKRKGWRLDPRIPKKYQIIKECYGRFPKFSRGHMTRRMDPMWGTKIIAKEGNADSMHVTNAIPQIQPFNAGIWLGLEDYALENAEEDKMKISVFTGAFFDKNDIEKWGVKIPKEFWKIICFVHQETKKLTVTGYTLSQEALISDNEFVFGQYKTFQTPVRAIEVKANISFNGLADHDPLSVFDESIPAPLMDFSQIKL